MAYRFEYSIECPVAREFARRFWSDVNNWAALRGDNAIRFGFAFQKETDENTISEYGEDIILKFRES